MNPKMQRRAARVLGKKMGDGQGNTQSKNPQLLDKQRKETSCENGIRGRRLPDRRPEGGRHGRRGNLGGGAVETLMDTEKLVWDFGAVVRGGTTIVRLEAVAKDRRARTTK